MLEALKGKKTYITGFVAILAAVAGYLTGDLTLVQAVTAGVAALQTMNLRNAIG